MSPNQKPCLRLVRLARARIAVERVGAQYRLLIDGVWRDTRYGPSAAEDRALYLARRLAAGEEV